MMYQSVTNLRWANAEHTVLDCVVNFSRSGPAPFSASAFDEAPHGAEIFARAQAGEFGAIAEYVAPPQPSRSALIASTFAKARAMRLDIFKVLDGLQASALTTGDTTQALAIEASKQSLRDITAIDLSACTTQAEMDLVIYQAYLAIAAAAPASVQSAFQSLVP